MTLLAQKRVVVTGASQGIGRSVVLACAREGADVVGLYRRCASGVEQQSAIETANRVTAMGRRVAIIQGDVACEHDIAALARLAEDELGGADIWVNNAGVLLVKPFVEMTGEDWNRHLAINLLGYVHGCRVAAEVFAGQASGGCIINVSSIAHHQPSTGLVAYSTVKGGVAALTRALALEFAPLNIRVNAVAPGPTETPLNATAYTEDVRRRYRERIALGRIAEPEEIADVIALLAADGARFVTGQELIVDGGMTINGSVGHARA